MKRNGTRQKQQGLRRKILGSQHPGRRGLTATGEKRALKPAAAARPRGATRPTGGAAGPEGVATCLCDLYENLLGVLRQEHLVHVVQVGHLQVDAQPGHDGQGTEVPLQSLRENRERGPTAATGTLLLPVPSGARNAAGHHAAECGGGADTCEGPGARLPPTFMMISSMVRMSSPEQAPSVTYANWCSFGG